MPILYMLVGIPGSGKSYWAAEQIKLNKEREKSIFYVSRDAIRFSMIGECDAYFSREKDVFKEYVRQIQEGLSAGHNVIADATHLNETSRNKLLNKLDLTNVEVCPVVFETSYDECVRRNNMREGRKKVPESILKSMYNDLETPTRKETYAYSHIFVVANDMYYSLLN